MKYPQKQFDKNAAQISKETGRHYQTVISWVHKYNNEGAESLFCQKVAVDFDYPFF
ncbi:MAG: helix-turn-helix domain-containing protein [Methyloprofundus sp.]|nr:helix-turn-helix domain-containing protein [Methyloprofundus sp.]